METTQTKCRHLHLTLLPSEKDRVRCRHCHLTIKAEDLETEYCPECMESMGIKRNDFEKVAAANTDTTQYRCEECGVLIDC